MRYNEVIERLRKLIGYEPAQSELCRITGVKQSTMSQRAKDNSSFKPSDIEKLNNHFGINIYTAENTNNQKGINFNDFKSKTLKFGVRLNELQKQNELSDKDFSKLIGLYTDEFIELKSGLREPNLKILTALKQHFNISVDYLLFGA